MPHLRQKEFLADRVTQKYCCSYCRRYAHRHGVNNHVRPPKDVEALRSFRCIKCGRLVRVTEPTDKVLLVPLREALLEAL